MLDNDKRSELKGTIIEAGDDQFVLAVRDSATPRQLAYKEVVGIWGKGMPRAAVFGIAIGTVGAIVGILYAVARASGG